MFSIILADAFALIAALLVLVLWKENHQKLMAQLEILDEIELSIS